MQSIIVKGSAIEGRGIFAARDFKKGDAVLEADENRTYLSKEEAEALPDHLKIYVCIFNGRYLLISEPERYINHSCNPNIKTAHDGTGYAVRDIKTGEELTGDYTDVKCMIGFECRCNDENCKKPSLDV